MHYATLEHWVNINSGSGNLEGLRLMADALQEHLSDLEGRIERISLPAHTDIDGTRRQPGDALRLRFRPEAPVRVLFSGHMDTVYHRDHPFQRMQRISGDKVNGPGVADMKGGLLILIEAVKQFLLEDRTRRLGGEILITADEEVGSRGSQRLLLEAAGWNHLGLVFESALPGGELVRSRKGTGTFRITAHGKAAHTGRDFENGRNAIVALADLLLRCHELNGRITGAIVNVGTFTGGGTVNVVPDFAAGWLNVRIGEPESVQEVQLALSSLLAETGKRWPGIRLEVEGDFTRLPKIETPGNAALHELWNAAEHKLGLPESGKRDTGGSSDGNVFGAAGLPHLDGIGIRGGAIHSDEEFAFIDSIPEQIAKTVAFLHLVAEQPDCLPAAGPAN